MNNNIQENFKYLLSLFPAAPNWDIDWERLADTPLKMYFKQMEKINQNPIWHGEKDVFTHTKMACTKLVTLDDFRNLPDIKRQEVFLAMLLHDIGKIPCTRKENGVLVSPNHTKIGSRMAREFLWRVFGLSGNAKAQNFRETVCNLIRYHSVPTHIIEQKNPEQKLIRIASNGELAKDFCIELLCILEKADVCGRISKEIQNSVDIVELCKELAHSAKCLKGTYDFKNDYVKYAYFQDKISYPEIELYDNTWGEVILMAGLPGTGKDTWIQKNYSNIPVISLDDIRKQLNISYHKNQGKVINYAKEQAKEYLRNKQPFVWNATSITYDIRMKQISLFEKYNASVRTVFLETSLKEEMYRNKNREHEVQENIIYSMLNSLTLPERFECQNVDWYCV